jgi:hypothetical protein
LVDITIDIDALWSVPVEITERMFELDFDPRHLQWIYVIELELFESTRIAVAVLREQIFSALVF